MPSSVQAAANRALGALPYSIASKGLPLHVVEGYVGNAYNTKGLGLAGVNINNGTSPIYVSDSSLWNNPDYTPQLLRHEMTHILQNNWPPKIKNALPPVNRDDPYSYGGVEGLKKIGGDPMKLSVEQQAQIEQEMQAMKQNGVKVDPIYRTFDHRLGGIPLSMIEPTDPDQEGINTNPRSPGLPLEKVTGMGKLYAAKTIPVKPGSGDNDLPPGMKEVSDDELPPGMKEVSDSPLSSSSQPSNFELYKRALFNPVGSGATAYPAPVEGALQVGGRALGTLISPFTHPIKTVEGMGNMLKEVTNMDDPNFHGPISDRVREFGSEWKSSPALALENAAGDAIGLTEGGRMLGGAVEHGAPPVGRGLQRLGAARFAIPSASHAGAVLDDIASMARNVPVYPENTNPSLVEYFRRGGTGSANLEGEGAPITKLAGRTANVAPLNFPDAREFYTNITRLAKKPGMLRMAFEPSEAPDFRMRVGGVRDALNTDLTDAAARAGRGDDYVQAMNEYRRAAKLKRAVKIGGSLLAAEGLRRSGFLGKAASGVMNAAR